MKQFEIYIAYVSWGVDGKARPILVFKNDGESVLAYAITTQYSDKSENVKYMRFEITEWQKAGLHKKSYIDINKPLNFEISLLEKSPFVGTISRNDKVKFLAFVKEKAAGVVAE